MSTDHGDFFRQMRQSDDPQERQIGEFEQSLWTAMGSGKEAFFDQLIAAAPTEDLRNQVIEIKRQMQERSQR